MATLDDVVEVLRQHTPILNDIKAQAIKTNGRITRLESELDERIARQKLLQSMRDAGWVDPADHAAEAPRPRVGFEGGITWKELLTGASAVGVALAVLATAIGKGLLGG